MKNVAAVIVLLPAADHRAHAVTQQADAQVRFVKAAAVAVSVVTLTVQKDHADAAMVIVPVQDAPEAAANALTAEAADAATSLLTPVTPADPNVRAYHVLNAKSAVNPVAVMTVLAH